MILVDKEDKALGTIDKLQAHIEGRLHRAFSICIFREVNSESELLLQQRHQDKYHSGGLWSNTCCSHPRSGETVIDAASRRLQEEMGFTNQLSAIGSLCYRAELENGLIEHEYDHILVGKYSGQPIRINPMEVLAYKWISVQEALDCLQEDTTTFTPWFSLVLQHIIDKKT